MKSRRGAVQAVVLLLVWVGGVLLHAVGSGAPLGTPADAFGRLRPAAGEGGVLAAIGGFRGPAADWLWLRANLAWERRDAGRTLALLQAVVAVDERPEYFWVNGARMIAFDLPAWADDADEPAALRARRHRAHAERALAFLAEAVRLRGATPGILIEMARIRLAGLGDPAGAAEDFGRAAGLPEGPEYAARLRVRLLLGLGQPARAEAWLRDWLERRRATMPAGERERWRRWLRETAGGRAART